MMLFSCTIPSRCVVKKNTQRVVGVGRRKRVIYSPQFSVWENEAIIAMRMAHRADPISDLIKLVIRFYFKNYHAEADTSNLLEGPNDCFKKAGVILDDKLIRKIEAEKFFGYEPRTEIELYKYEEPK